MLEPFSATFNGIFMDKDYVCNQIMPIPARNHCAKKAHAHAHGGRRK